MNAAKANADLFLHQMNKRIKRVKALRQSMLSNADNYKRIMNDEHDPDEPTHGTMGYIYLAMAGAIEDEIDELEASLTQFKQIYCPAPAQPKRERNPETEPDHKHD